MLEKGEIIQTVGRRKEATARVVLRHGDGEWAVNGRRLETYFPLLRHQKAAQKPLHVVDSEGLFDVQVNVRGGGISGQADAVKLGLARALLEVDEEHKDALRDEGLLTRDARVVERKKPGRPKARKRFQFSKR